MDSNWAKRTSFLNDAKLFKDPFYVIDTIVPINENEKRNKKDEKYLIIDTYICPANESNYLD